MTTDATDKTAELRQALLAECEQFISVMDDDDNVADLAAQLERIEIEIQRFASVLKEHGEEDYWQRLDDDHRRFFDESTRRLAAIGRRRAAR